MCDGRNMVLIRRSSTKGGISLQGSCRSPQENVNSWKKDGNLHKGPFIPSFDPCSYVRCMPFIALWYLWYSVLFENDQTVGDDWPTMPKRWPGQSPLSQSPESLFKFGVLDGFPTHFVRVKVTPTLYCPRRVASKYSELVFVYVYSQIFILYNITSYIQYIILQLVSWSCAHIFSKWSWTKWVYMNLMVYRCLRSKIH